ncbi:ribonuclease T2-like [Toensbergia leucococca]|nr:ribonuclease T2-like [Toensbergia leucococca]
MRQFLQVSLALVPFASFFLQPVAAGHPAVCPSNSSLSCHNSTFVQPSCCFNYPGGQLLQTQYWDTDPASGPADHWTVHGLWPDHCDGTYDSYCDASREYTNISSIISSFGRVDLLQYMEKFWTDYHGNDESFWAHEFGKHATCINTLDPSCYVNYKPQEEVVDFFHRTVELFKTLDTYKFLAMAGIYPSTTTTYTFNQIQSALRQARGVNATFQCTSKGELDEMWYTFDIRGSVQTGQFVATEPVGEASSCNATGIKYLPKNLTSYYATSSIVTTSTAAPIMSMR